MPINSLQVISIVGEWVQMKMLSDCSLLLACFLHGFRNLLLVGSNISHELWSVNLNFSGDNLEEVYIVEPSDEVNICMVDDGKNSFLFCPLFLIVTRWIIFL